MSNLPTYKQVAYEAIAKGQIDEVADLVKTIRELRELEELEKLDAENSKKTVCPSTNKPTQNTPG